MVLGRVAAMLLHQIADTSCDVLPIIHKIICTGSISDRIPGKGNPSSEYLAR